MRIKISWINSHLAWVQHGSSCKDIEPMVNLHLLLYYRTSSISDYSLLTGQEELPLLDASRRRHYWIGYSRHGLLVMGEITFSTVNMSERNDPSDQSNARSKNGCQDQSKAKPREELCSHQRQAPRHLAPTCSL
ncbi:hypothetical protein Y1Q_0015431 [Alligator mississippiensis]|uniref:Uncharacterized protein n=1 Tax=Alligator mississippiensis TaxID=8496 RepID=A0A151ND23_ALLMI|nr:hypothetical protein Y1Q_0015431 [Alligator mississippiensis]